MSMPSLPPRTINSQGNLRRVGFELEYQHVSLVETAELIAQHFHGRIHACSHTCYEVECKDLGKFTVMLDQAWMQEFSQKLALERAQGGQEIWGTMLEDMLTNVLSHWLPNELVTPPLPLDMLSVVDEFGECLRKAGAKGTRQSPVYAFGLHINAELPAIAAEDLVDYLAAFALLQEELKRDIRVDLTRQLSPYTRLYSQKYVALLMQEHYRPNLSSMMDDYLAHNPTRNRALDMLPAFALWDREKIIAAVGGDKHVRPRPTFHYRLPNSDVDNPTWSMIDDWNRWVRVEELAEHKERLHDLKAQWRHTHGFAPTIAI